jgi:polyisoprenoid-binding protein YceI
MLALSSNQPAAGSASGTSYGEAPMSTTTTTQLVPAGTYAADPAHSRVGFAVKHLGIATVRGEFGTFEGSLAITEDGALATGTITAASVDTNEPQRDAHLRSPDFFDVERHPEIGFRSTAIRPVDDETFEIAGELTLHGVTREIALTGEIQGTEVDPWGNERVGLEITGQLNRGDFGMKFNQALGSGNMLVSDKVKLSLDVSAVKQS